MEQFDHFEDFWREELGDFESEPSPKEWDAIRDRLHPKRRAIPLWWLVPIAAALVGVGVFRYLPTQEENKNVSTRVEQRLNGELKNNTQVAPTKEENKAIVEQDAFNQNNIKNDIDKQLSRDVIVDNKKSTIKSNSKEVNGDIIKHVKNKNAENLINDNGLNLPKSELVDNSINTNDEKFQVTKRQILTVEKLPTNLSLLAFKSTALPNIEKVNDVVIAIKEPVVKKQSKLKGVYFGIGTSMNYRNINPITTDAFTMTAVQLPNLTSYNRLGWQASVGYKLPINKHLAWRVNLQYQGFLAKLDYRLKLPEINNVETVTETTSTGGLSIKYDKINLNQTTKDELDIYHNFSLGNELGWTINNKNALYIGCSLGKMLAHNGISTAVNTTYSYKLKGVAFEPYFQYHLRNYAAKEPLYNFQSYAIGINFVF